MKYKLSILIPSRCEMFLARTVQDIIEHKRGDTEVLVGLDGAPSEPPIMEHPDVRVLYYPESIGQRAMTNRLCEMSTAKYVLKCDAHCSFDEGFDVKMLEAFDKLGDDVTMVPVMRNLHVFDWVCPDGHRRYQGPSGPCLEVGCGKETTRDIVWIAKTSPQSKSYCFDSEPHFQYFAEYVKRPEVKKMLEETRFTESMSLQGSCFMMTREKYWELKLGDETWGSWGSQGIQIACSTWLSGGRVMVNHNTWYAHCFRTQGGDFSFPYPQSGKQVAETKKYAKNMLYENKFPQQILPSSWLIEKFWPVPGWKQEELDNLKLVGSNFVNNTVLVPRPEGIAGLAKSFSAVNVRGEGVSPLTVSHFGLSGTGTDTPKDINPVTRESQVGGITTQSVTADMIDDGDIFPKTQGYGPNKPRIDNPVDSDLIKPPESNPPVSTLGFVAGPVPTPSDFVEVNLREKVKGKVWFDPVNNKHLIGHTEPHFIPKSVSKSIIFYTDNQLNLKIAHSVQDQLKKISQEKKIPIVSASLKPMDKMGKNIHLPLKRGILTMYKQILAALEASTAEIVFFCEHDVLYHPSHFDFTPTDRETFYYNINVWKVRAEDGHALWVDTCIQVSGLSGYRNELIQHYRERVALAENSPWERKWGYEPGTPGRDVFKIPFKQSTWKSEYPNLDIRHDNNLTANRWSPDLFRNKKNCEGWTETTIDKIPGWERLKFF